MGKIDFSKRIIAAMLSVLLLVTGVFHGTEVRADSSLDSKISKAEGELAELLDAQADASEKRSQGTLGFIDYMLTKNNLTENQKKDLNNARAVIEEAMNEDFNSSKLTFTGFPASRNNKVTAIGDPYDAISLMSYPTMFDGLRQINNYRATDDLYVGELKCDPAYVNFYYTALAQTGADRAAGYKAHNSYGFCCECLAFGCFISAWYDEKSLFEKAMSQLGMTKIASRLDVSRVESKATANGDVVGHYTNMFWAKTQVMGLGFADYGKYGDTTCLDLVGLNTNTMAYYTIDQFEALYNEYYATVEPEQFVTAIEAKKAELDKLYADKYAACTGHSYTITGQVKPDCTNEGYDYKKCSKCGHMVKSNIKAALGHDLTDGVCGRCGVKTVKSFSSVSWQEGNYVRSSEKQTYDPR